MTTTERRRNVTAVDAAELAVMLLTAGACLVGFGLLTAWSHRGLPAWVVAWVPQYWPSAEMLLVLGAVAVVGGLVVGVLDRDRRVGK